MWNSSLFGGSDGGFLANDSNSTSTATESKGPQRMQNIVPVCIRQVLDHPDDEFTLFGMQTQILVFMGILREYEVQSTKVTYEIEDHTGRISAIYWLENDAQKETPSLPEVKEGRYVQLFGSLRTNAGKKTLMIVKMHQVDDLNIIASHLLQVIRTRLEAEAMSKGEVSYPKMGANVPGAELANSMSFMDAQMGNNRPGNAAFTPVQQKVYDILQKCNNPNGLARNFILEQFPHNQHNAVSQALEFMSFEGYVYTTIDSDHFMATNSM